MGSDEAKTRVSDHAPEITAPGCWNRRRIVRQVRRRHFDAIVPCLLRQPAALSEIFALEGFAADGQRKTRGRVCVDRSERKQGAGGKKISPGHNPNSFFALSEKIFRSSRGGSLRLSTCAAIIFASTHGWSLEYSSRSGPAKS